MILQLQIKQYLEEHLNEFKNDPEYGSEWRSIILEECIGTIGIKHSYENAVLVLAILGQVEEELSE